MTRRRLELAAFLGEAALLAGCNAILGLGDPVIANDAGDGGAMPPDAAPEAALGPPCPAGGRVGDDQNCGRCGHSCLGGACAGGTCQPFLLASAQSGFPSAIAVDPSGNVYWSNKVPGGILEVCPVGSGITTCADGGVVTFVGASPTATATPDQILLPAGLDALFWNYNDSDGSGGIQTCPLSGCTGMVDSFGVASTGTFGLAASTMSLYTLSTGSPSAIFGCAYAGCVPAGQLQKWTIPFIGGAVHIAWQGSQLFWTASTVVQSCDPSMCSSTIQIAFLPNAIVSGLATDDLSVYFTDESAIGAVYTCPLAGCMGNPTTLASNEPGPGPLAVDGAYLYWIDNDSGTHLVRSCLLSTCAGGAQTLATSNDTLVSIAVDSVAVYWTAAARTGQGTVWKLAK